jgi:putative nucleotidyltransferase with HDIG domain
LDKEEFIVYDNVKKIWPEIEWIEDEDLKEKVYKTWEYAIEKSVLSADDLEEIPFTLLIKDCDVTFMEHKRAVVHIAVEAAKAMNKFFGDKLPINMDYLIAGAILIDVGKLVEYVLEDGKAVVGKTGKLLRHPFTGVEIARRFEVPDEICHMIATHSKEGDLVKRTTESIIIHHADFLSYEPFKPETLRV